jgi:dihydrodipicolinate synthase/N-acetylneuraminate lyase
MSAALLTFDEDGQIDFESYTRHLAATAATGLIPAVNMDTGYVNLLTAPQRQVLLSVAHSVLAGQRYVAALLLRWRPATR